MGSVPRGEGLSGAEDEDPGLDAAKSRIATDGLGKTCFGRRFVVDPAKHLVIDVPAGMAVATGEKAMETGMAGVAFAVDLGRNALGGKSAPAAEARQV